MEAPEQNSTTEPTDAREIVTIEPTLAADVGLESPTYTEAPEQNSTNEATVGRENTTNELTHAVPVECGPVEGSAGMNDGAENEFDEVIDRQRSVVWNRAGLVRVVALRAEKG
jgi:hypothetical protein